MKNSSQSNSSSKSKNSQNKQLSKSRTKSSFIRKFKTEDFSLRKKLMNQNCIGKLKVFLKEYQQHIYLVLEDPSSSNFAKLFQFVLFLSILLSSVTITIDSIFDTYNDTYNSISSIVELYLFIFFAVEYILRLITASAFERSFFNFILSPMTIIDLLAILPFILNQTLTQGSFQQLRVLRLIRFSRIFRLFKLSRFMKAIAVLAETVKSSLKDILMLIVMLIVMVLLFSTIIYYLEYNEDRFDEDKINSIPDAIWWCIVTMTTVGYGDLIPHTIQGKMIASIAAILGTTTISLPVAIIGINLYSTIKENEETIEIEQLKSNFENQKDQISNDQLNKRELQYMQKRLDKLFQNNEKVLDCLEKSQELYDELTTNLMSLYQALAEEMDLHFEFRVKRLKMKQRIMKIEKNIQQKKSIELNQLIHSYREKQQIIAASPMMMEESRIESLNSMNSRLQSYGNTKRSSNFNQIQRLRSSYVFRSAREINSELNSDANLELKSQNAISNLQSVPHVTNPMEDTPICLNNQKIQSQFDVSSRDENLDQKSDNEYCDIQNKIEKLQL